MSSATPVPTKPSFGATILLLISEPVVRLVMREVLDHAGYLVMATGDVGTAVDRINESKPDLLIVSPYVDSVTGYAAAKYLRTHCPGMRVLMVAGLLADDRLQNRAELERFDIFPEPFTASHLLKKVAEIIDASARVRHPFASVMLFSFSTSTFIPQETPIILEPLIDEGQSELETEVKRARQALSVIPDGGVA